MPKYDSDRGMPLVYVGEPPPERPILTVENYCKWYSLYLVKPGGWVEAVDMYDAGSSFTAAWHDHVPDPGECERYAELKGYDWDENALDMIYGRYQREVVANRSPESENF